MVNALETSLDKEDRLGVYAMICRELTLLNNNLLLILPDRNELPSITMQPRLCQQRAADLIIGQMGIGIAVQEAIETVDTQLIEQYLLEALTQLASNVATRVYFDIRQWYAHFSKPWVQFKLRRLAGKDEYFDLRAKTDHLIKDCKDLLVRYNAKISVATGDVVEIIYQLDQVLAAYNAVGGSNFVQLHEANRYQIELVTILIMSGVTFAGLVLVAIISMQ